MMLLCVDHKEIVGVLVALTVLAFLFRRFLLSEFVQSKVRAVRRGAACVMQQYVTIVNWIDKKSRIVAGLIPHCFFVGALLFLQHKFSSFRYFFYVLYVTFSIYWLVKKNSLYRNLPFSVANNEFKYVIILSMFIKVR